MSPCTPSTIHGDVDVDDVAVAQLVAVGDAVADDLVDRRTHRLAEPSIVEWRRIRAAANRLVVDDLVDLVGGDARLDERAGVDQHFCGHRAGPTHRVELGGSAREGRNARARVAGLGVGRLAIDVGTCRLNPMIPGRTGGSDAGTSAT